MVMYVCISVIATKMWSSGNSTGSSSSLLHSFSYSDIVRIGSPVSSNQFVRQSGAKKGACKDQKGDDTMKCHQSPVSSNAGLNSFECSVCPRTFNSKRGLRTHFSKVHRRNDTAFEQASEGQQDAGDMESVTSERSDGGMEKKCYWYFHI